MNPDASETSHYLIVRNDLQLVNRIELGGKSLTIGRSTHCDIALSDHAVSRQHARLDPRGDGWYVIDTGSVNGVTVNGRRIKEAHLTPGDVVEIRPFALNYMSRETDLGDHSLQLAGSSGARTIARDYRDVSSVVKQRLEDLYALARLVIQRKDNGSFWPDLHATLQDDLAADRCVVVGVDEGVGFYRLAPQARPSGADTPLNMSRSVLNEVIGSGRGMLIQHVADDGRFAGAPSLAGGGVGSVICVPLLVRGKTRAVVYADRQAARMPFAEDDLDFVMAAVDLASTAVDIDELQAGARELARVRGRIDAAREMQELLLPRPIPQPAWGRVAALNRPADQMSGDVYDVAIDSKGRLLVSMADVSGKGVPAAFAATVLQNALRSWVARLEDLGEIVRQVNTTFDTQSPVRCFATMVICRWSCHGDMVEIASAGHHAPLWLHAAGDVEPFPEKIGLPLGVGPVWTGEIVRRDTATSVLVLLYSDGITEARNPAGQEYGMSRLAEQLGHLRTAPADAIITAVVDDVRAFCAPAEPADDVTLLIVKRDGAFGAESLDEDKQE